MRLQCGLILRFEQAFERAGWQLGESLVCGREHGERARPFQRIHQSGGFHGRYQSIEIPGDSGLDNIARGCAGQSNRNRQSAGE